MRTCITCAVLLYLCALSLQQFPSSNGNQNNDMQLLIEYSKQITLRPELPRFVYNISDENGDGKLNATELGLFFYYFSINDKSQSDLEDVVRVTDKDLSGGLEFYFELFPLTLEMEGTHFILNMDALRAKGFSEDMVESGIPIGFNLPVVRFVFNFVDQNKDGQLNLNELKNYFQYFNITNKSDEELQTMLEMADKDQSGGLELVYELVPLILQMAEQGTSTNLNQDTLIQQGVTVCYKA